MHLWIITAVLISVCQGTEWSYSGDTGPDHWADDYAECAGSSQSPIDIDTRGAKHDEDLKSFNFDNYGQTSGVTATLENNGHSAVLYLSGVELSISGGTLPNDYIFGQLHFHWGADDTTGSEHSLDDEFFPLELHLVHYSDEYDSVSSAMTEDKGLAVLGFFFKISDDDNTVIDDLIDALADITSANYTTNLAVFSVRELISPGLGEYYRYSGSLTTPGCYESVIWTVFEDKIPISSTQLAAFRALMASDSNAIESNYRPVQPLNSRTVKYSSATKPVTSLVLISVSLLIASIF